MKADSDSLLNYFLCAYITLICKFVSIPFSPRTGLFIQSTTCGVEIHVHQDNCSPLSREQPGGTQDPPDHLVFVHSSLPFCAIKTLPFSVCAMTPERWDSTV